MRAIDAALGRKQVDAVDRRSTSPRPCFGTPRRFPHARPMRMVVMRFSSGWTITRLHRVQ